MKKLALVVLAGFLLSGSGYAQVSVFPWTEGFEGGTIPAGWAQSFPSGTAPWFVDYGDSHTGYYSVIFAGQWGDVTKLITPQLNLNGLTNPVLKFWHAEPNFWIWQDTLKVYYRSSVSGAWNLLAKYSNAATNYVEETIALPNGSNDYYIAFEGISDDAAIFMDDITVFDFSNYVDAEVVSITAPTTGINLTNSEQVKIVLKNNGSAALTGFSLKLELNGTPIATETYSASIPSLSQASYTFTNTVNLSAQGNYTIKVTAIVANDKDTTNDSKTVNVFNAICSTVSSFPWVEGFESGAIHPCWTQAKVKGTEVWMVESQGKNTSNYLPHNGAYYAEFANESYSSDVTKLITPPLNITSLASPVLKFWHLQQSWGGDQDTLKVYYKSSSSGAWNLLATYSNNISVWKEETIALPNASTDYYIAFEGTAVYGYGIALDDIRIYDPTNYVDAEVVSITAPTSGVNLTNTEQVKVVLKNNGAAAITGFSLELRLNGSLVATETYSGTIASSGQAAYTFTNTVNLSAQGNYTIKVTVILTNDMDTTNNSKTATITNIVCGSAITAFPWTEGFEGGTIPPCWAEVNVKGSNAWMIDNYYTYSPHGGTYYALFANSSYSPDVTKLIMPSFDLTGLKNPILKFWHLQQSWGGDQDTLKVYYKSSSGGAWNLLATYSNNISVWTEETIALPNASTDYYIAFEGTAVFGYGVALDDITVFDFNYTDIEVAAITAPTTGINLTNSEQVTVLLKNNGSDTLTGFSLELRLNGSLIATEIYSGAIPSLSQASYTFTNTVNLSAQSTYTINVTAIVPGDQNLTNNAKTVLITNTICNQITVFPWIANFNSGIPACWTNVNASGSGSSWARYYGSNGVRSYSYYYNTDNWLITPPITLDTNYSLTFDAHAPYAYSYGEKYSVLISTTGTTLSSFTAIYTETLLSSNMKSVTLPLNAYKGQTIYIAFRHWDGEDELRISDIKVLDLSNYVDVEIAEITAPPASGINLSSTEQVTVLLKNNGGTTLTGFSLKLELNGTPIATETFTGTIPAFGQAQYTFNATLNLSAQSNYTIKVTATMANDQNPANNSKTIYVSNIICSPVTSFPWAASFNYSALPVCWATIDANGSGGGWGSYSSNTVISYSYSQNIDNWLITPQMVLDTNYSLFFDASVSYTYYYGEKYSVLISTTGTNPSDFTAVHTETITASYSSKAVTIPLDAYKGQSIYIAFRHWGYGDYSLQIGDVKILNPSFKPEPVKLYAYRTFDNTKTGARLGFVSFETSKPQTITQLNNYIPGAGNTIRGVVGEYVNGDFYYYFLNESDADFVKVSPTTLVKEFTKVTTKFPLDMTYDFSTNTMYGVAPGDYWGNILVTIDLQTGEMTPIGYLEDADIRMLACNKNGQLYGLDYYGYFCSIDKTNAAITYVGNTGYSNSPYSYRHQTMSFDHNTGRLFWAKNDASDGKLIEINPASGYAYDCGSFYDNAWIAGLYTKPLDIVSHFPAKNAVNVEINTLITVTFDKNITEDDLSGITITPNIDAIYASISGNVLNIAHEDLKHGTQYTVTIPAGAIENFWETITWKFTTKKNEDVPLYSENEVRIYPNPTTGKLRITNYELRENTVIEIFDIYGKLVYTPPQPSPKGRENSPSFGGGWGGGEYRYKPPRKRHVFPENRRKSV